MGTTIIGIAIVGGITVTVDVSGGTSGLGSRKTKKGLRERPSVFCYHSKKRD